MHLAFVVDDLDEAIKGKQLLGALTEPMGGVRVAMILENGAPMELMEFASYHDAEFAPDMR